MEQRVEEAAREKLGAGVSIKFLELEYGMEHCLEKEDGYTYLNRFYSQDVPFRAIGFKLLYKHSLEGPNSTLWDYIVEHPEIKIVHFQRENLLEIVCSHNRAVMSGQWHATEKLEYSRYSLSPDQCQESFDLINASSLHIPRILKSHPVLNIDYQQLCDNFQRCIYEIYSFLGVNTKAKLSSKLIKIAQLKPNEEIINYQELKEHFKDTQYGEYFKY